MGSHLESAGEEHHESDIPMKGVTKKIVGNTNAKFGIKIKPGMLVFFQLLRLPQLHTKLLARFCPLRPSQSTKIEVSALMKTVLSKKMGSQLPVQVGRTNNVSSLGLAVAPNIQDSDHIGAQLPVQVGRINNVSSLGLAVAPNIQDYDHNGAQLPVQVGRTNNVSSLGLAVAPNIQDYGGRRGWTYWQEFHVM
jgi:hypothetical protein